jgi:ribosomal protein L11 methyltransferase
MEPDAGWMALRVEVAAGAADAVTNFLFEAGAAGVVAEDDAGAGDGGWTRLEAHVAADDGPRVAAALRRYLRSLAALEPGWGGASVEEASVPAVDWQAVYRAHHRPLAIGRRLLVAPPWDVPAADGRIVLVIEPGMAFGTGQHATTRTCLEEIEAAVDTGGVRSALDVGTGSGVLAAALARLGVARVVALDVDAAVLPIARANLARNDAAGVALVAGDVGALRQRFDLVVANLLADTIVAQAAGLAGATAPGGRLVVSGILDHQAARVRAAFPGRRLAAERADGPWRTLALVEA